ncbi:MAG: hypothetical protein ACRD2W_25645 [Acidimicrobiales bacterium]
MPAPGAARQVCGPAAVAVVLFIAACAGDGGVALPGPSTTTTTASAPGATTTTAAAATTTTVALDRLRWRTAASAPVARQEVAGAARSGWSAG